MMTKNPDRVVTISVMELLERFPDEAQTVAWLEKVRWGDSPVCHHCGAIERISPSTKKAYTHWCGCCRKQFTVRSGTFMHASKIPVRKWLMAIYFLMTARKGISSLQLSKELSLTQKSAWYMLHRIREACSDDGYLLSGAVEVDETYLGGLERNKHKHKRLHAGTGGTGKQAVIGARQRDGRVVAKPIPDGKRVTMQNFIHANVEKGTMVYTDDHLGYYDLSKSGYGHATVRHTVKEFVVGMAHTNGIESVWAVLKRGYNGIYHNWSHKHMQRYVDEFAFRLNEGNCKIDTMDRIVSLFRAGEGKRLPYADLVK